MSAVPIRQETMPDAAAARPAEAIDYEVTPGFVELLERLGCSLLISNYQSSTVMAFSALGDGRPLQMFAPFRAAMGLAVDGDQLAIATRSEVVLLTNARRLAQAFPKYPGVFDGYYLPRARYLTGECQMHDLAFGEGGLLAVNTAWSCICRLDGTHSFVPVWTPPFVSAIRPGDRCHLNGMALEAGALRYVTALGTTDAPRAWTDGKLIGGVLIDTPSGEILAGGLCMPHSPRIIGERLFLVEAGTGRLVAIDRADGHITEIVRLPGFARGLAEHGGYLFVGLSLVRESLGFKGLPVERDADQLICGVAAVEIASGRVAGTLRYIGGCTEIHDIQVVEGVRRLGISGWDADSAMLGIDTPDASFWLDPSPGDDSH